MKRVAIFGSPGSGKSTLARQLSARTGLPVIHLDQYYFNPGWEIKKPDDFRAAMADITATEHWITDGNYLSESSITGRIDRADTLILLECPRLLCMWRVIRRIVRYYGQIRPDQAVGCPERFDWEFLQFVWNYPAKTERIRQLLKAQPTKKTVLIFRNKQEVAHFLTSIQNKCLMES